MRGSWKERAGAGAGAGARGGAGDARGEGEATRGRARAPRTVLSSPSLLCELSVTATWCGSRCAAAAAGPAGQASCAMTGGIPHPPATPLRGETDHRCAGRQGVAARPRPNRGRG